MVVVIVLMSLLHRVLVPAVVALLLLILLGSPGHTGHHVVRLMRRLLSRGHLGCWHRHLRLVLRLVVVVIVGTVATLSTLGRARLGHVLLLLLGHTRVKRVRVRVLSAKAAGILLLIGTLRGGVRHRIVLIILALGRHVLIRIALLFGLVLQLRLSATRNLVRVSISIVVVAAVVVVLHIVSLVLLVVTLVVLVVWLLLVATTVLTVVTMLVVVGITTRHVRVGLALVVLISIRLNLLL